MAMANAKPNENIKRTPGFFIPVAILIIGVVLLVLNIVLEDEPGALPLFTVLGSGGWLVFRYVKLRLQKPTA
jgi:phosphotransferase system  glucose/maltose/N-acetylglucosamine-specific IIC component